jgi:hypothetical protein
LRLGLRLNTKQFEHHHGSDSFAAIQLDELDSARALVSGWFCLRQIGEGLRTARTLALRPPPQKN